MKSLALRAIVKYIAGLLACGVLLFLPAGTLAFPGGWRFLALLFLPMLLLGAVLLARAPELLEKRLQSRESSSAQRGVIGFSALLFLAGFLLAGLDFRFGWSQLPLWAVITACVVFLIGYGMYAEVMRENAWLSRTVEVQENQNVIDTGLYGIVRHPMYTATILMFLSLPLVLGSLCALLAFLAYPILLVLRIREEETLLTRDLPGYAEYSKKVRWRLIPFLF